MSKGSKDTRASVSTPNDTAGIIAQNEALFRSIGDGVIATDEFGRIVRINPIALKLLDYTESEVLGEWFPKIFVALDESMSPVSLIDRPITRAFLTGQPVSEKMLYRTKRGLYRPVQVTVSPILLDERPIGAVEVFRDITQEHEVDRMKSEFISLASHQLRTPLSSIKTYSHMLLEGYMGDLTAPQRQSLNTIIGASDRMNELINMLLNVTRVESGSVAITPRSYDMVRLCEDVCKEMALLAKDKEIKLTLRPTKNSASIRTDVLLTKEILINLVSNAIKYSENGGQVRLKVAGRPDGVLFTVTDDGMGIPAYSQEHVFTKFFRAQNVVTKETSGTGLGLYLVKGLVELLGGKIWFKSVEHVGTTFYLWLPKKFKPNPNTSLRVPM
jgi:PAS domain S-box-containing protein